ncbi:hypothetical protein CHUAL_006603 [Chamberlinius hualienensis]
MALVLLPCDLPTWPGVQRILNTIKTTQTSAQLAELMQRLYTMCCISLDPDENDRNDGNYFSALKKYLDETMTADERSNFFLVTLPTMATCALQLKHHKPINGLQYSLQQQADCTHLHWTFVTSLLACAFFSTFPKRTVKTHPTLQDFNLAPLFLHLSSLFQQKKLTNLFRYFDRISTLDADNEWTNDYGEMITFRQVINKKTMLTIDDWLKCNVPLCPLTIKNDGRIGQTDLCGVYQVCFSNTRIGGDVLRGGERQEDDVFCAYPELLSILASTESLDNNETFVVHFPSDWSHSATNNAKSRSGEFNHVCFIDALDFRLDTISQYNEQSILRELNKCYIGFLQHPSSARLPPVGKSFSSERELQPTLPPPTSQLDLKDLREDNSNDLNKNIPNEVPSHPAKSVSKDAFAGAIINQPYEMKPNTTTRCRRELERDDSEESKECQNNDKNVKCPGKRITASTGKSTTRKNYRMTMGERREGPLFLTPIPSNTSCVPELTSTSGLEDLCSMEASFMSCRSHVSSSSSSSAFSLHSEDGYVSCNEEGETTLMTDPVSGSRDSTQLESSLSGVIPKRRDVRRKLPSESSRQLSSSSSEGEPFGGMSDFGEESEILKPRRSGSTGFLLQEELEPTSAVDENIDESDLFPGEGGLEQEREWLNQFRRHRHATYTTHTDSRNSSSRYSFSSDFSSDLEDIYEHFEEKMTEGPVRENPAYASYGRHLKRTLSDSLTSIPTCRNYNTGEFESSGKHVPISAQLRSLSLTEKMHIQERLSVECAKRLIRVKSGDAESPIPENLITSKDVLVPNSKKETSIDNANNAITVNNDSQSIKSIVTGNWGCGHRQAGDPQLKAIIQWMAASKANAPNLIYYTSSDARLVKLNIVYRVLLDRHWTVGHVAKALLRYAEKRQSHSNVDGEENNFFSSLLPKETEL